MKRLALILLLGFSSTSWSQPPLPAGLSSGEPSLPTGLDLSTKKKDSNEPSLPGGLTSPIKEEEPVLPTAINSSKSSNTNFEDYSAWSYGGFGEARLGKRLHNDPRQRDTSLAEARLQLTIDYNGDNFTASISSDLLYDDIIDSESISLNQGRGKIDLREAWLQRAIGNQIDIKAGRQVLTWGTGDLVFINDLFSKDWNSFFIGRDTEYLKAPSDAIKLSFYLDTFNVDLIWNPEFDSDRYIDGKRISYFNPLTGSISGREMPVEPDIPNDNELAFRIYKTIRGIELAAYGYQGYWKSPNGFDPQTGDTIFPALAVLGASVRGNLAGGIANTEIGYYDSKDDSNGKNPFINNSEIRVLVGFERELATNLTGAFQYYVEHLTHYNKYRSTLLTGQHQRDKNRQLLTSRLTWLTHNQNMTWSLFIYYSPSDNDWYGRPKLSWKVSDALLVEAGMNLFGGAKQHTFFAQFEDASNIYSGIRYSF
jgi:hypothetical protein